MSKKVGKGDIHFQPKWGQVLLSLLVIAGAVWLFWWCIWGTPLTGAPKVVVAVLVILLDCLLCFSAGMNLIFNFYSRGVWATPEEMKMTLPGEDLISDPEGRRWFAFARRAT